MHYLVSGLRVLRAATQEISQNGLKALSSCDVVSQSTFTLTLVF